MRGGMGGWDIMAWKPESVWLLRMEIILQMGTKLSRRPGATLILLSNTYSLPSLYRTPRVSRIWPSGRGHPD